MYNFNQVSKYWRTILSLIFRMLEKQQTLRRK